MLYIHYHSFSLYPLSPWSSTTIKSSSLQPSQKLLVSSDVEYFPHIPCTSLPYLFHSSAVAIPALYSPCRYVVPWHALYLPLTVQMRSPLRYYCPTYFLRLRSVCTSLPLRHAAPMPPPAAQSPFRAPHLHIKDSSPYKPSHIITAIPFLLIEY